MNINQPTAFSFKIKSRKPAGSSLPLSVFIDEPGDDNADSARRPTLLTMEAEDIMHCRVQGARLAEEGEIEVRAFIVLNLTADLTTSHGTASNLHVE